MTPLDLFIAKAQRNLSYLYWLLFTGAFGGLILLPRPLDETIKTVLIGMIGVLGTLLTQQSSFWYARQRAASMPDPTTTTTQTTTTTTPSTGDPNATAITNPTAPIVPDPSSKRV